MATSPLAAARTGQSLQRAVKGKGAGAGGAAGDAAEAVGVVAGAGAAGAGRLARRVLVQRATTQMKSTGRQGRAHRAARAATGTGADAGVAGEAAAVMRQVVLMVAVTAAIMRLLLSDAHLQP